MNTNWHKKYEGVGFYANNEVEKILNTLTDGLPVDIEDSNPRSLKTVPTWHVFFKGVRILELDVNKGGILFRIVKLIYWPDNITTHPGFNLEKWNKGKTANLSLRNERMAQDLRPLLKEHLQILESVLNGNRKDLKKPLFDKKHLKEQYFETEVTENLNLIEPDLKLVRRQLVTSAGRLDLLCSDKNNLPVVIELKIALSDTSVLEQIKRYIGYIKKDTGLDTRGIILHNDDDNLSNLRDAAACNSIQVISWKQLGT